MVVMVSGKEKEGAQGNGVDGMAALTRRSFAIVRHKSSGFRALLAKGVACGSILW